MTSTAQKIRAGLVRSCQLSLLSALALMGCVLSSPLHADIAPVPSAKIWSPEVLSGADRERYIKIFKAEKRGDWKGADKIAASLSDKRLMGYVLFEKYMQPHYKTTYAELRDWLAKYNDHQGADKIYKLALRKRPKSSPMPQRAAVRRFRVPAHTEYAVDDGDGEPVSDRFADIDAKVRELVRKDTAVAALSYLKSATARNVLTSLEFDKVRERIAASLFLENRNEQAYLLATEISDIHARDVPLADWYAGLAAWRMGHFSEAARHFEHLAHSQSVSDWTRAAGGFWAARAYLADRKPGRVADMLELAASTGSTFYGLVATRQLGRELNINWIEPRLEADAFRQLVSNEATARAVALAQIGRRDMAEQELVRAHAAIDPGLDQALIALASNFDMPALELQVANAAALPPSRLVDGKITMNAGLFPVPDYKPRNGFKVDPALLYAFMRQESKFQTNALSFAGARGLMQIMPATASHITNDATLSRANKDKLLDPTFNLSLGQDYLTQLMTSCEPYGNLFMLTTAYNGGPGNLVRWLDNMQFNGDPFLFIESIPAPETRGYIERVLTNYWIYSARLGKPLQSLDASASGAWPIYDTPNGSSGIDLPSLQ